jgi:hypothetical protein
MGFQNIVQTIVRLRKAKKALIAGTQKFMMNPMSKLGALAKMGSFPR